jgi:hypothetical protein
MAGEVKLATNKSMEQRIKDRLCNSGEGAKPHVTVKQGESAQRVFHNIHYSPNLDRNGGDKGGR